MKLSHRLDGEKVEVKMETVELYLVRPNLSNTISWVLYEPEDVACELDRKTFVIPEGFTFEETVAGELAFFDKEGHYSEICTNQKTKMPFLWDENGKNYFEVADLIFSTVKDLRRAVNFTQKEFSEYFGIPKRTVECWERGQSSPPDYLVKLMEYKLRREGILAGEVKENQE